jgi:hypothetical protein
VVTVLGTRSHSGSTLSEGKAFVSGLEREAQTVEKNQILMGKRTGVFRRDKGNIFCEAERGN